ncbi:MAG: hybrid sensor histidine kinase/response regulator [Herminiimonas sp.]|nr:hybrid sensor histidine kinase/response regulator [Herminiimonas sp.]
MIASVKTPLILNVDDTEAARYVKSHVLTRAGFEVIEAGTGSEAIARAQVEQPALILLDIKLPDINGFEVCRRLKQDPLTKTILVLQTSASYIASADKIRALDGGADNYLFEPIEPEELVANVRALLRLGRVEQELREADRRKDIFLATLAHELRNPLAPILTAAELLSRLNPNPSSAQALAHETIKRQTKHLIRLVDELLEVSRIAKGKIDLKRKPTSVQAVVQAAMETASAIMAQREHKVSVQLPAEVLWIDGDSVRLAQAVGNLLRNAGKFTPPHGHISLTAEAQENEICIRVEDNGIGLSPENVLAVFDLFMQAEDVLEGASEGLGLGLSIAKGLVELHGGTISAASGGPGQGSTFEIRLPSITGEAPQPRHAVAPDVDASSYRVLMVDDNVGAVDMFSMLLEIEGHTVFKCNTGGDALAQVGSVNPQIIVLDIGLPDMSGLDVAREVRKRPGMEKVVLIALTGYGRKEDKERASDAGFDAHLTKPVTYQTLMSTIESLEPAKRQ